MAHGMVRWFDGQQARGSIALDVGGEVSVSRSAIVDPSGSLEHGQRVECRVVVGHHGWSAEQVRIIAGPHHPDPEHVGGGIRTEAEVCKLREEVTAELALHPECRLLGMLATLDWALGARTSAPVTGPAQPPASVLDLMEEEDQAHEMGTHPRLSGIDPEYIEAVEHTLLWLEASTEERPRVRHA